MGILDRASNPIVMHKGVILDMSARKGQIDGISYETDGDGVPILFVPPPVIGHQVFHYQAAELAKDYRIIRFDLRGHGQSSISKETVTYPLIAQDIRTLMDHLGIPQAVLCGYSMGGSIVLEFLRTYPTRCVGALLMGGFSEVRDVVLKAELVTAAAMARMHATDALALAIAWGNADCRKSFRNMLQAGRQADSKAVADLYDYAIHYNCTPSLHQMNIPMSFLYGAKEPRFHQYGHLLNEYCPQSEMHLIPNVSHQIPTKAPAAANQHIRALVARAMSH
jgi:pimeloyl-ACP methyl ester carboxylesterase